MKHMRLTLPLAGLIAALFAAAPAAASDVTVSHGESLFGDLKYPPGFDHLDYVNPDAPKGGEVVLSAIGTYDTLNPFTITGVPATGLGLTFETLMDSAADEPSSMYGLLAETIAFPEDRGWVEFKLREQARWHDGRPVTPEDVIFSFEILRDKGAPFYRAYYGNVTKAEQVGERTVRFTFDEKRNRELPHILGQLPVLPKHYWAEREFGPATLEPPLGSGPYRVARIDPGRTIAYERVPDWWGRDLPINRGRYNFDRLRYEYYRDPTVALEAFKAHGYDFRLENTARVWATGYDFPAVRSGAVVKEELENNNPTGMQAFAMNLRRPQFRDPKVREALNHTFDFEWTNRNLFYGQYARTESYFSNSDLAAEGLPSEAELKYLEPLRGQVPEEVFTTPFDLPETDGSGQPRQMLRQAATLLAEAGWKVVDGALRDPATGEPVRIEFLLASPDFERIVAPIVQNMKRLGIEASIRVVDPSQYVNRLDRFDFDITVASFPQSLSPGNEQRDFWGSAAADQEGSRNVIGIENPAVDRLIEAIIQAENREELVAASRALDRVLLWNWYVIPNWHNRTYRVAYWDRFGQPETKPKYGLGFPDTWWIDPARGSVPPAVDVKAPR